MQIEIDPQPDSVPQPLLAQQQYSHEEGPHSPKRLQMLLHDKLQESKSRVEQQLLEQPQAPLQQAQEQTQPNLPRGMASAWLARMMDLDARGSGPSSEILNEHFIAINGQLRMFECGRFQANGASRARSEDMLAIAQ